MAYRRKSSFSSKAIMLLALGVVLVIGAKNSEKVSAFLKKIPFIGGFFSEKTTVTTSSSSTKYSEVR